ncbi:MAG TPA: hypothetical protein VFI65_32145 [Streptosporangiaceae bacterium]|nr:hypothetical protein [Streptosporangiaceae bacterium]
MTLLAAAVIFVGCLCLLDLLLTFGVLRRLREHATLLASIPAGQDPGLAPGGRPAPFTALSTTGQAISGPSGLRIAAFFSTSCSVCPGTIAPFVQYVKSAGLHPDNVLAVVAAEADAKDYLVGLSGVASVCLEPHGGSLGHAFQIKGYPAFFLLDSDGVVVFAAVDPATVPKPVTA